MSAAPRPMPPASWMITRSLWLAFVVLGAGVLTWLGFLVIGIAARRFAWLAAAAVYGALAIAVLVMGDLDPIGVLLQAVLWFGGTLHAVIVNHGWLRMRWAALEARRAGARSAARAAERAQGDVPVRASGGDLYGGGLYGGAEPATARGAVLRRADRAFRAVLEQRTREAAAVLAAAAERGPVADAAPGLVLSDPVVTLPIVPTPLPTSTPLTSTPLTSASSGWTSTVLPPSQPLDPRTASAAELATIPGLGPERAAALVAARDTVPLAGIDDVVRLLGLQPLELVRVAAYLRFPPV